VISVMDYPSISIVIPTFNSGRVLKLCLDSIVSQDYPKDMVQVIIADAGSTDDTVAIARGFTETIVPNPLKTGEAGKAAGYKHAKNDIIAFVDSDNILPSPDWLRKMTEPYADGDITGTEPIEYTYRRTDGAITRYSALMGMNDPLCLFLGNYDRLNLITGKWTEVPLHETDMGSYIKISFFNEKKFPTIGANGFMVRKSALDTCGITDYLFDIDVIYELYTQGFKTFAKVKTGIIHLFCGDIKTFIRKQKRRVKDYLYYAKLGVRKYPWNSVSYLRLAKFIIYTVLISPVVIQACIGYSRKHDPAWFLHPLFCILTLWYYGTTKITSLFQVKEMDRKNWSQ